MDDDDWRPAYLGAEIILLNYLHLVGITVLYWDHLITLGNEVNLIWGRPKSLSAYCFFLNRYFAFFSGIPVAMIAFLSPSTQMCLRLSLFRELALVVTQMITSVIMIIRVYALYGRSKRVLWFLLGVGAVVVAVSAWSVNGQKESRSVIVGGCHFGLTESTSYRWCNFLDPQVNLTNRTSEFAGSWEGLFGLDSVIFGLTIWYAYSTYRPGNRFSLSAVIVRDGAMYFGLMALSNLVNIATYYLVDIWPFLPGALGTFANCMSITLISRLILNLHEHANAGILSRSTDSEGAVDLSFTEITPQMTEVERDHILHQLRGLHSTRTCP
ncbi:hypothetical protein MSAN_00247100 [Mycena sanguinolenta]|uniref:DUF6533 domain-containing protein n=1 Tax=Mycena sanguinolenta TaxID=230812 RepID=A0A8H7DMV9_9AGAR|nr:hypothetical protein MSAN_00247100 [Mycena sanguinolenta]